MKKYLRIQRLELAQTEIDAKEELEQSILYGSTIQADGTIDCRAGIYSKIARKWLNRLGYK